MYTNHTRTSTSTWIGIIERHHEPEPTSSKKREQFQVTRSVEDSCTGNEKLGGMRSVGGGVSSARALRQKAIRMHDLILAPAVGDDAILSSLLAHILSTEYVLSMTRRHSGFSQHSQNNLSSTSSNPCICSNRQPTPL